MWCVFCVWVVSFLLRILICLLAKNLLDKYPQLKATEYFKTLILFYKLIILNNGYKLINN